MRSLSAHERRISRRLEGRGLAGLGEALGRLHGTTAGGRFRLLSLFAVGAEGAVFLACDTSDASAAPRYVAKIPLMLYHKPITLDSESVRRRRAALREEGRHLTESASPYMPRSYGLHDMANPLMEAARGGAFAEPEPVLVMERLPGFDLDVWLARMHGSEIDVRLLRRTLDAVTVAVLQGLWDLQERGYYYADLRPGNVRIGGQDRRARLLDAGSMVRRDDCSGRFPYVPAYLPPDVFERIRLDVERPFPTAAVQAVMAGRTLHEVATGRVPVPGEQVDLRLLWESRVSQPVADTIEGLCAGSFGDVRQALKYLHKHAARRVPSRLQLVHAGASGAAAASPAPLEFEAVADRPVAKRAPVPSASPAPTPVGDDVILPPAKPKKPLWRRLLGVN
jgi:hypothetical protein